LAWAPVGSFGPLLAVLGPLLMDAGSLCKILVFHSRHHRKLSIVSILCGPTYKVTRVINNSLHSRQKCSRRQRTLAFPLVFPCVFWKFEVGNALD